MLHLLQQTRLDDAQKRYVRTATSSSELLLTVINDILDSSKLEANKIVFESVPFNPVSLAEETVATLANLAYKKGLELVCSVAPEVPCRVKGDPTRLRQVLTNLLSNAIKFTESGYVALSVSYDNGQLHIGVTDTGIGLNPEQQKSVFAAFTQADSQMPVMDEITATGHIRALSKPYTELPILAMTTHALSEDREKSPQAGMNGHITKPIEPPAMFGEIAQWLEPGEKPAGSQQKEPPGAGSALPQLPGIETGLALQRLGGNKESYTRILRNYRTRNLGQLERMASEIASGDLAKVSQTAHMLKGSSGNIGAMQVHQDAADLERKGRSADQNPEHATGTGGHRDQIQRGIAGYRGKPGNTKANRDADHGQRDERHR